MPPSKVVSLRLLQQRAYRSILLGFQQGHKQQTLCSPTGSGKSLMASAVSALLLTQPLKLLNDEQLDIRGVIIAVPQLSIFQNFLSLEKVEVPAGLGRKAPKAQVLDVGALCFQRGLTGSTSSPTEEEIELFWRRPGSILVMTHAKFRELVLPEGLDLSQYMLNLDEAHHAPRSSLSHTDLRQKTTTMIGEKRDEWVRRNGKCLQISGTPWHTESGERIYTEEEPLVSITIAELRREGLAPQTFEMNRVMLDYKASTLTDWLLERVKNRKQLNKAYVRVVDHWEAQKRPYTVIRIPDRKHVRVLKKLFEAVGARVFDASDETGEFSREKLETECQETDYNKRSYDIVLACRRFDEGTDLPFISNVYYLGAPTSARLLMQLFGRAFRSKAGIKHYPKAWADKASLTIFTPKSGDVDDTEHQEEYLRAHRQDATLIAAYLADMELGDRIITELSDRMGGSLVFGRASEEVQERTRREIHRLRGDDYTRAQVRSKVVSAMAEVAVERDEVMGAVSSSAVLEKICQIDDVYLRARCVHHYIELVGESDADLGEALANAWVSTLTEKASDDSRDLDIRGAYTTMIDAVKAVAHSEMFSKLHKLSIDRGWLAVMSRFTGLKDVQIAQQLRRLAMPRPTQHEIARTIFSFIQLHPGQYPDQRSGKTDKYGLSGYTFAAIHKNWKYWSFRDDSGGIYTSMTDYGRALCGLAPKRTKART